MQVWFSVMTPEGYGNAARRIRRLAPALLWLCAACLDLTPIEVTEFDVNTTPVFLPERVLPRPSREPIIADIGASCAPTTFSATLLDYDGDPKLYGKWILQATEPGPLPGDPGTPLLATALKEEEVLPTALDLAQVLGADVPGAVLYREFELELSRETISLLPRLVGTNTHLLELYVSDRRFGPGLTNVEPVVAEGEPRALVAYTSWIIQLRDTDCEVIP